MRMARQKKGQFIIIAALMLSIMIIAISTVIYGTVTYYRQERWEEYVTIVDSIKTASCNLLQIGLANYSQTSNPYVLRDYFNQWMRDVRKAYPGFGVGLSYSLASGIRSAYGVSLNYSLGLARTWNQQVSFSASDATVDIDVASLGLSGYNFSSHVFLKMNIRETKWYYKETQRYVLTYVSVDEEGLEPVVNLQKSNFEVKLSGLPQTFSIKRYYSSTYKCFIYEIRIPSDPAGNPPSSVEVALLDTRRIKTVSYTTDIKPEG